MVDGTPNASQLADLLDPSGPFTAPLDAAAEYVRDRIDRVLPLYVAAMLPHAVLTVLLIDAITAERRSAAARYCLYLTAATVWRWVWLARLQWRVQEDLRAAPAARFWRRVPSILLLRLCGAGAVTWGSFLAGVPAFYGLFVGSFAAPLLLDNADPPLSRLRQALRWVQYSAGRLLKVALAMGVLTILAIIVVLVSQAVVVRALLPTLAGVDTADLSLTLSSWAWRLTVVYFVVLAVDAFWAVASVILYYESQSRRLATDLRARLFTLTGEQP